MTTAITPEGIKALRDRLTLSQADLARLLGVDVATVSRWERGETAPRRRAAQTLARLMAGQRDLTAAQLATEAAFAWEGETHVLRAMERARAAGVSPLAASVLLPDAIRAHAEGTAEAAWLLGYVERGTDPARLYAEVARLTELGLWPWRPD